MQNNLFIALVSIVFSIVLCELIANKILGIASFSDYELRFKLNGVESFAPGFYQKSKDFPISGKRNIDITWEDMTTYPFPTRVKTDSSGYRNSEVGFDDVQTLFVGDSVVFGYGLPTGETIPSVFEIEAGEAVYSLAVSGWGPASYMKAVSDFSDSNSFTNLIILYTLSNDDINYMQSCWPELEMCEAPEKGPISRLDMPDYTIMAPPNILITSPLRHSSLVNIVFSFINGSTFNLFDRHRIEEVAAPEEIKIINALNSLDNLSRADCIDGDGRAEINRIKSLIKKESYSEADELSYYFTKKLISQGCAPLITGDSFGVSGLSRRMNHTFVSRVNVSDLTKRKVFTSSIGSDFSCRFQCNNFRGRTAVNTARQGFLSVEKKQIFTKWLNAKSRKYNVSVFLIPAEHTLHYSSDERQHWLCGHPSIEFRCFDLQEKFADYYAENAKALFLDSSHLNKAGVDFTVSEIIKKLNSESS